MIARWTLTERDVGQRSRASSLHYRDSRFVRAADVEQVSRSLPGCRRLAFQKRDDSVRLAVRGEIDDVSGKVSPRLERCRSDRHLCEQRLRPKCR